MSAEIISDLGTQCQKSRKIPQSLGWRTKSDDLSAEIWQSTNAMVEIAALLTSSYLPGYFMIST